VGQTLLTQEEIEALLALVQQPESELGEDALGRKVARRDFSRPEALPHRELERLWARAKDGAQRMAESLTRWLRLEATVELMAVEPLRFGTVLEATGLACLLYPIRCGAGGGQAGCVSIDPSLALASVDRVLGGGGRARFAPRALTSVERRVADRLAQHVTQALADALADSIVVTAPAAPPITRPREARFLDAQTACIVATYTVGGELAETELQVVLPTAGFPRPEGGGAAAPPSAAPPALGGVEVELAVTLGETALALRDLLALEPGDVVPLSTSRTAPLAVSVEGSVVAAGRAGTRGGTLAIALETVHRSAPRGGKTP
jgi:flagellar motor switch protein FliM